MKFMLILKPYRQKHVDMSIDKWIIYSTIANKFHTIAVTVRSSAEKLKQQRFVC